MTEGESSVNKMGSNPPTCTEKRKARWTTMTSLHEPQAKCLPCVSHKERVAERGVTHLKPAETWRHAVHTLPSRPLSTFLTLSGVDSAFAARLFSPSGILNIRKLRSG